MTTDDPATKKEKPKPRALVMNLEQFNDPHIVLLHLEGPHVTMSDAMKLNAKWDNRLIFETSNNITKSEYDLDVYS